MILLYSKKKRKKISFLYPTLFTAYLWSRSSSFDIQVIQALCVHLAKWHLPLQSIKSFEGGHLGKYRRGWHKCL